MNDRPQERQERRIRLGIDVGGTFTDVVAIDAATREPIARVKVPTSHDAPQGVAAGIVEGIERLLRDSNVPASAVSFIAHSTTQATNALLEGDVAQVGVVGLLGRAGWFERQRLRFRPVALAAGVTFAPHFRFAAAGDRTAVAAAVEELLAQGVAAIAFTQAFGVDRPQAENEAAQYARERGAAATSGHDVGSNYGLRARTRTAALNAAMLPKMMRTSQMTAAAVRDAAISAPLMIMRSDGGVMDVREIERRPILTMLSGPAAGVAGALLYDNVSDGLFVEVGGTSSDCSVIRNGKPQMHPAKIGGHATMLRTLDVRTLGLGGGSMVRIDSIGVADVGPRSAHIAGCGYACFTDSQRLDGARLETIAPLAHDPADYAVLIARDGIRIAPTLTCAANALGAVPSGAFAFGNAVSARIAYALLADKLGSDWQTLARAVLDAGTRKLRGVLETLVADYALDRNRIAIVAGGGGAGAIVPYAAGAMQLPFRMARDAEVIAPIGVALALVRDVVERTIVAPTAQDIARIRREAIDRAVASGAAQERVEVTVEIDARHNIVRAIAAGSTALVDDAAAPSCDRAQRQEAAARALRADPDELRALELTGALEGYRYGRDLAVVDRRGVVRLTLRDAEIAYGCVGVIEKRVIAAVEAHTRFGDVGRSLPALYVLRGERVAAFEGLITAAQASALAGEDVAGCDPQEAVAILTVARQA